MTSLARTSLDCAIGLFRTLAYLELHRAGGDFDAVNWARVAHEFFAKAKAEEETALNAIGVNPLTYIIYGILGEMRGISAQSSAYLH